MATFKIEHDQDAENPRENDCNLAVMACVHGRYQLGDREAEQALRDLVMDHPDFDESVHDTSRLPDLHQSAQNLGIFGAVLPLYLYDHSGITMATTPFSCPFDSGQVGFVYMLPDVIAENFGIGEDATEKAFAALKSEVAEYDAYIRGDATCYVVEDDDGEVLDSCGGFYGYDVEENGMLEHLPEKYHELALASA